ncbi:MAG: AMP-binding protein [Reyranella sp.]|uniref:AMP-binding protein n=1 Tax=Reyranella sp. TaxID=1929291 RepID=UPI003D0B62DF
MTQHSTSWYAFDRRLKRHFEERSSALFCRLIGNEDETALTWRDLEILAGRFTSAYVSVGVREGQTVLVFIRHRPELYGAFIGAMLGGFVPSYMPCTSPRQDPGIYWSSHQTLLDRTRPAAIVADRATFSEVDAAGLDIGSTHRIVLEDLGSAMGEFVMQPSGATALLQHSSGTTGLKKGVALTYNAIVRQIESYATAIEATPSDVIVSWLPLYHDMGLMACCLMPAYLGIPIIHIDPFTWLARPELLLDSLANRGGTLAWLPNFAFDHMATVAGRRAADYDLSKVRAFINCSEPCKAASFDRFAAAFAASGVRTDQLQCCYAMAETVFAVSQTRLGMPVGRLRVDPRSLERGSAPRRVAPGEVGDELLETGRPIAGIEVAVYDAQRRLLPNPTVGEIGIRGEFLFSGYNKDPERTAERLVDGTYFTRDLGFVLEDRVYVLGRIDDLIIVNGRNLYAHEVEAVVSRLEGLKPGRSVAVPLFNARIGSESLVVICERQRGSTRAEADLRRGIMQVVHSTFEVTPWRVHIVEEGWLIKTTSGKISRKENLARLQQIVGEGVIAT